MGLVETRRHQIFPVLDLAQIETAKPFASGEARSFAPGEVVFDPGCTGTTTTVPTPASTPQPPPAD